MTEGRAPEFNFVICYAELVLLILFAGTYRIRDRLSHFLLLYPLASIPSLVMATGNFYQSIFLTTLLCMTAFAYRFYLDKMPWMLTIKIPDLIVLTWVSYGVVTMIHQQIKYGQELGAHLAWGAFALTIRSGGLGASNHAAGLILLFLPFVKNIWIMVLANLFLLTTASRGVYFIVPFLWLALLIKGKGSMLNKRRMNLVKAASLLLVILVLTINFLPKVYREQVWERNLQRVFGDATTLSLEKIRERLHDDARQDIRRQAIQISMGTYFQGIGIGGFYWGQGLIGAVQEFSNAHNLYLTLLCEGGLFFLMFFLGLLAYMLVLASRHSGEALISLVIFSFYGLFSGEIYSTSGLASACDYYYLVFILAYLKFIEMSHRVKRSNPVPFSEKCSLEI